MKKVLLCALLVLTGCDEVKELQSYTVVEQAKRACSETGQVLQQVDYGPMTGPNIKITCRQARGGEDQHYVF